MSLVVNARARMNSRHGIFAKNKQNLVSEKIWTHEWDWREKKRRKLRHDIFFCLVLSLEWKLFLQSFFKLKKLLKLTFSNLSKVALSFESQIELLITKTPLILFEG